MTLRSKLIRLAHEKPALREALLPLLKEASFEDKVKGKKFRNPATGNEVEFGSLPDHEQEKIRDRWHDRGTVEPLSETPKHKPGDKITHDGLPYIVKEVGKKTYGLVPANDPKRKPHIFSRDDIEEGPGPKTTGRRPNH